MRALEAIAYLDVTRCEALLLRALAILSNNDGVIRGASQTRLARDCGWRKIDSVRVVANRLARLGLIQIDRSSRDGATAQSYRLLFVKQ